MVIGQNFQSMQSLCTYSLESNLQIASTVDLEWELELELLGQNLSVMPKKKVSEVASPILRETDKDRSEDIAGAGSIHRQHKSGDG
jgi:hypothetical protein